MTTAKEPKETGRLIFSRGEFEFMFDAPTMMAPVFGNHPSLQGAKQFARKTLSDYVPVTIYTPNATDQGEPWLPHSTLDADGVWELHWNMLSKSARLKP